MGCAGKISLADLTHLVIDEADTMFDESFIQDLKGVLKDVKVRFLKPSTFKKWTHLVPTLVGEVIGELMAI